MEMVKKQRPKNLTQEQGAYFIARKRMVENDIRPAVKDERVLAAMMNVPRDCFVPDALISQAYSDYPIDIGDGQTVSQPLIVAMMTELLELKGSEKILEIGTGSGYQTAILCELCRHVYSVERITSLSNRARKTLYALSYTNFTLRIGDGTKGWDDAKPFDGIIVTAGAPVVPDELRRQLNDGGRLVIPVGGEEVQELLVIRKNGEKFEERSVSGCRFVKLIGEHGWGV